MFAAIAVLLGAIISMTTSGAFVAAQTGASNTASSVAQNGGSLIDTILAENEEEEDDDEEGEEGTIDEDCTEDDESTSSATTGTTEAEDEDEPGDVDAVDDDEGEEEDDDENENDDEDSTQSTGGSSMSGNSSVAATNEDDDEEEEELSEDGDEEEHDMAFDPCNFTSEIDNPYLPLSKYVNKTLTFEGQSTEDGEAVETREVWQVQSETIEVADVETLAIFIQEFEDGELVQEAVQYYAQGKDGVVYYFGEDIVDYDGGVATENDEESWTVGDDTMTPGIAMPSTPATGMGFAYQNVDVPGIAHELSEVTGLNQSGSVQYGAFTNAVVVTVYEFDEGTTSEQTYESGIGLVRETDDDEEEELVSIE
jgi:hypothetical protein